MTEIKIKKVVKMSSEDSVFKAENLLKGDKDGEEATKWIGAKDGEIKQYVVLELEKATEIHQISVENESSAFIEIRVGDKNAENEDDDFEVLLSAVAFMTPSESKNRLNSNRLKIFTSEKDLDKDIARKRWQRVHIICTQSFNPNLQFGLSSIKFYDKVLSNSNTPDITKIKTGSFSLKKELSDSADDKKSQKDTDYKPGSLFKKEKEKAKDEEEDKEEAPAKAKAAPSTLAKSDYFLNLKRKPATESEESEDEKEKKLEKKISMNGNAKLKEEKHERKPKASSPEQVLKGVIFALSGFQNPLRSDLRDLGIKLGAKYRPDWTDDCTHLICAFSNTPKAAQVRKEGGKIVTKDWLYGCEKKQKLLDWEDFEVAKPDSDSDSDADSSKPRRAAKNAQKKISKLKKKDEYDDSYDEEEAENSDDRDFIVNSSEEEEEEDIEDDDASEDSNEEEESMDSDDSERVVSKKRKNKKKGGSKAKKVAKKDAKGKKTKKTTKKKKKSSSSSSSASDSDDDIEAYKRKKEKELLKKVKKAEDEPSKSSKKSEESSKKAAIKYDESDEEAKKPSKAAKAESPERSNTTETNSDVDEEPAKSKAKSKGKKEEADSDDWELPTFFDGKEFYVYGDFPEKKLRNMKRQLVAFGGNLNNYMSDDIDYVITDKEWNKDFEKAKKDNKKLVIVNEDWLDACTRRKKLVAHQPYEVKDD